jgi:hypothetical protein
MRDDPTIWSWIEEAEPEITEPDALVVAGAHYGVRGVSRRQPNVLNGNHY